MPNAVTNWTLLTTHGVMLIAVARNPQARILELAEAVGITERQAHRVLADLRNSGYITAKRVGRRNEYSINTNKRLRHPSLTGHVVNDLLETLALP